MCYIGKSVGLSLVCFGAERLVWFVSAVIGSITPERLQNTLAARAPELANGTTCNTISKAFRTRKNE